MGYQRLPRFRRSDGIPSIKVTPRDRQILLLVYRHRFLRSSQILALLEESSLHVMRRLQWLYHHGYLERPRAQLDYYGRGGSRPMVYGLGDKGWDLLKQESDAPIRWGEKNRSVGRVYLEHALMVSDVMVFFELACRARNDIRLVTQRELLSSTKPPRWSLKPEAATKVSVVPDQIFALERRRQGTPPERLVFFLEADRGTMPVIRRNLSQTSVYRKFLAYRATWSQSLHRKKFGFNRFRVLMITKSAKRVASLLDACSQLKSGHGLFVFMDYESFMSSTDILTCPWQTGRAGITGRLIE